MSVILQSLPSTAIATCAVTVLPGKWLAVGKWKIKLSFFPLLLHVQAFAFALAKGLNSRVVFHLTFSPLCIWEGRAIELLGGHLSPARVNPSQKQKALDGEILEKLWELSFWTM